VNDNEVEELLATAKKEAVSIGMFHSPVDSVMELLTKDKKNE